MVSLAALEKHIKETNWYRQGGAAYPFYVMGAFISVSRSWGLKNVIIEYQGQMHRGYFNREVEERLARLDLERQIRDKNYIDKMIWCWSDSRRKLKKLLNLVCLKNLRRLDNKKLLTIYKKMFWLDSASWKLGGHIETFDPCTEALLAELLQKYNAVIPTDDLAAPGRPSVYLKEEAELAKLKLKGATRKEILRHVRKYHWVNNDWANVVVLPEDYFAKRLKNLNKHDASEIIAASSAYSRERRRSKSRIIRKYKIGRELQNVFYFFSRMAEWRDARKSEAQIHNFRQDFFLAEFARRSGMDRELLKHALPQEIMESGLDFSPNYGKLLESRRRGCIHFAREYKKFTVLTGRAYQNIKRILDSALSRSGIIEGKGAVAGRVRGRVKIVNVPGDFSKMKFGDVLVAPMTRPEYVPLMRMAAAIVTDEGGLTCHAAIMSRELGIPCVIGTQVATDVLKDDDLVEVDAERGVVRKLRSN